MTNSSFFIILIFASTIFLSSCGDSSVYEEKKDFEDGYWLFTDPVYFPFEIEDETEPYDLSLFVRSTLDYPYQNLYIQYYVEDSTGSVLQEKLHNIILFNQKTGKPIGSGVGDIYDLEKSFLNNFRFPEAGKYRLRLDQYMRHDTLRNVLSVGFKLQKSKTE